MVIIIVLSFNAAINILPLHHNFLHHRLSVQLLSYECHQLGMEEQCWTEEKPSKLQNVSPSLPEAHQDAGMADAA